MKLRNKSKMLELKFLMKKKKKKKKKENNKSLNQMKNLLTSLKELLEL